MADLIEHCGVVERTERDTVYVRITSRSACGTCKARQACGLAEAQDKIVAVATPEAGQDVYKRQIYEDAHIFADNLHEMGLMATRDIETYMKIFRLVTTLIPKPDLLIYLKASVPTLISQIRKRGREYEMNIDELYLKRLNNKYNHWIDTIYEGEVLVVDKDHEDFVSNPAVLERICARLDALKAKK